jgi:hypothetical protein
MSGHTPGPWFMSTTFGQQGLIGPQSGFPVASVTGYYTSRGQTEPNALLIAAAPDLLALAREIADNAILAGMEIGERARSVIAQATGEDA